MFWPAAADLWGSHHEHESLTSTCKVGVRLLVLAESGCPIGAKLMQRALYVQDRCLSAALDAAHGLGCDPTRNATVQHSPAWRFLLQVFVPCVQKHGRRPDQLFADFAERGDTTALQQLMAFDPTVRDHPAIRDQVAAGQAVGEAAMRKAVGRVRLREPRDRQEHATLLLALLLKQFSQLWSRCTAELRQSVDRNAVGERVWSLLTARTLNMTDIRKLLRAYDAERGSRLATFDYPTIEEASWDRRVDRFRTAKRPLDIENLTARRTVRVGC